MDLFPVGCNPFLWLFVAQIISDLAIGNSLKLVPVYVEVFLFLLIIKVIYAWVGGTWDLSVLLFSTSYKSIIISKKIFFKVMYVHCKKNKTSGNSEKYKNDDLIS